MFKIRAINKRDSREICKIQRETWIFTYQSEKENISKSDLEEYTKAWTSTYNIKYFNTLIEKENQTWLVAEIGRYVVGHIRVIHEKNHDKIDMFYVLPNYQNHGIGKKLLTRAIINNEKDILVDVVDFNKKAIKFYEKYDFSFLRIEKNNARPLPSGKKLGLIRMKKPAT